jgi:ABC-type thiamine transport system ATPase subunit
VNNTTEAFAGPECCKKDGKSFIYIKNNRGPKIEPCGTPFIIFFQSDNLFLYLTI